MHIGFQKQIWDHVKPFQSLLASNNTIVFLPSVYFQGREIELLHAADQGFGRFSLFDLLAFLTIEPPLLHPEPTE